MNYIKSIFMNRSVGFYLNLALTVLALVTGIVHAICYANFQNQGATAISWPSVGLCIGVGVLNLILAFTKQDKYAPYLTLAAAIPALCLFVYYSYFYVTVMYTGIDDHFNATYISNAVLFFIFMIGSFVGIYFDTRKIEKKESK